MNLKWENTPREIRLYHKLVNTGSSKYYGIVDWDGTLSGRTGPTLLGSAYSEWWKLDNNCVLESTWNMWACEKFAGREVGYLNVKVPGYIDDNTGGVSKNKTMAIFYPEIEHISFISLYPSQEDTNGKYIVGNMTLFGPGIPTGARWTDVTSNLGIGGGTGKILSRPM